MAITPPSPLSAFASTIFSAPFGLGQNIEHQFEFWFQLVAGDTPEWRRFTVQCEDLASQDSADDAFISFDVVNYTGGAIDASWDDADYTSVATSLEALCGAWAAHMDTHHRFNNVRAYRMSFKDGWVGSSPSTKLYPFNLSGAPEFTRPISKTGTGTGGSMIPQAAFSVTEIVPVRRSWGRFYLPFPDVGAIAPTTGRWSPTVVDAMATAVHDTYVQMAGNEFYVVVPITQSQKDRVGALEQVTAIRCDDVPDVIRRRRFKHRTTFVQQPPIS